ncbi:MAG: extracellular solute-binding protein [Candidatus Azotimanducaceae bacterium]
MRILLSISLLVFCCGDVLSTTYDGVVGKHGLAMHGEVKYRSNFQSFEYVNSKAPKKGTLRLHSIGTFDSFNSFIVKGNPVANIDLIYNTLTTSSADEPFSQYGELADAIYMPKDRSWVAFKLRPEARWHDGEKVSVDDVIWTFNILVAEGTPFFRFYYENVQDVIKVGENIVRFNFKNSENRELPLILGQLVVLPKHYWEERDFNKTTLEPPLGSGPYRVKKFEPGRSLTLERNRDYWGADIPSHKGKFNFNEIRIDYYRDNDISLEAFKSGEYDYRLENSSKNWATGYDIPAVANGLITQKLFEHNRPAGMQGFIYNTRRPIFKDVRVRQALALAFDFEWSNQNLFYGQYTQSRSYFDNSELAAVGLPSNEELELLDPLKEDLPRDLFISSYSPPKGGGPRAMRSNLRKANQLLNEAGWIIDDGKRIHPETSKSFEFEVLLVQPGFERIVLPFTRYLDKLGIEATVRTVDTSQYRQRLNTYDFDMIVSSFGQSLSPGNEQRSFWGSNTAAMEGGRNYIGISNPAIDILVEHIVEAQDRKELVTATRSLDRALQWGHWVIPHWHIAYDRIAFWDKFGRPASTPPNGVQLMNWWIDEEKASNLSNKLESEISSLSR